MKLVFNERTYKIAAAVVLSLLMLLLLVKLFQHRNNQTITATVDRGEVNETVSVSGFVEAKNTSDLAFPTAGRVTEVFVDEGDEVKAGDVLATQASEKLVAQRNEAMASLKLAEAALSEVSTGASAETRTVNEHKLSNAESELERVKKEQAELVDNARRKLLSTDLEAVAEDPKNDRPVPVISGTYTCSESGTYRIHMFSTGDGNTSRDYSLLNLENGNYTAYEDVPTKLGECGLKIQLPTGSSLLYKGDDWLIDVPNTRSSSYISNFNTYQLALQTSRNAIQAAEDSLNLTEKEVTESNSPARYEIIDQKQAAVSQAKAQVSAIDAELSDRSIVAPYDGVITNVSVVVGETASVEPVITILKNDIFEVTARIPEIDIRKVERGQKVEIIFDASSGETFTGHVSYVPMQATEIDGVAYFETLIALDSIPDWIRSGFNADINIIVGQASNTLLLPRRFVKEENDKNYVWINGKKTEVEITFTGNDGYLAISGLSEGTVVDTPPTTP